MSCPKGDRFRFNEDIYGHGMELHFLASLRPKLKFDSIDALASQMAQDVQKAKTVYHACLSS